MKFVDFRIEVMNVISRLVLVILCAFVGYCNYLFTIKVGFVKWRYNKVILSIAATIIVYGRLNIGLAYLRTIVVSLLFKGHLSRMRK
jgi:hypothetical protein